MAFYQNVSPSKELRDASNEAESLVRDFEVESSMRLDVFKAKIAAEKNIKESGQWSKLSAEDKRLVEKMVRLVAVPRCAHQINSVALFLDPRRYSCRSSFAKGRAGGIIEPQKGIIPRLPGV